MSLGHEYGFYSLQISKLDDNNYPVGQVADPTSISNGTTSHAYVRKDPVEATAPGATYGSAEFRGGMKHLGQIDTGLTGFGTFTITLSGYDDVFHTLVTDSAVETTRFGTSNRASAPNSNKAQPPRFLLMLSKGKNMEDGPHKITTIAYLNCQIRPMAVGANMNTGVNPSPRTYTVIPSQATRALGMLFSATSMVVEDNSDFYIELESSKRFGLTFYKDDGSATSVTMGYRPLFTDNDNTRNIIYKNGVDAASSVSGLNTSTGVATITAGTAADMWTFLYQTNFRAI